VPQPEGDERLEGRAVPRAHWRLLGDGQHEPLGVEAVREVAQSVRTQCRPPPNSFKCKQEHNQAGDANQVPPGRVGALLPGAGKDQAEGDEEQGVERLGQQHERDEPFTLRSGAKANLLVGPYIVDNGFTGPVADGQGSQGDNLGEGRFYSFYRGRFLTHARPSQEWARTRLGERRRSGRPAWWASRATTSVAA